MHLARHSNIRRLHGSTLSNNPSPLSPQTLRRSGTPFPTNAAVSAGLQPQPPPGGGGGSSRQSSSIAAEEWRCQPVTDVCQLLVKEQERLRDTLTQVSAENRRLYKAHIAGQERLAEALLNAHAETLQELRRLGSGGVDLSIDTKTGHPAAPGPGARVGCLPAQQELRGAVGRREGEEPCAATPRREEAAEAAAEKGEEAVKDKTLQEFEENDALLSAWRSSSGLHTVEDWVADYNHHPGGWGALLMIHGVPEITARLRSMVENYAIYSALFLSVSISLLVEPMDAIVVGDFPERSTDWWLFQVRQRVYLYCFAMGCAAHMVSILIAMTFVNALNEAARDSDVFRLFSGGQGFLATGKCQMAFRAGCLADCIGIGAALSLHLHLGEVAALGVFIALVLGIWPFLIGRRLLSSASIMRYWRRKRAGAVASGKLPGSADDPYDLTVPVDCFKRRANTSRDILQQSSAFGLDLRTTLDQAEVTSQLKMSGLAPSAAAHAVESLLDVLGKHQESTLKVEERVATLKI